MKGNNDIGEVNVGQCEIWILHQCLALSVSEDNNQYRQGWLLLSIKAVHCADHPGVITVIVGSG
jgi:hypothetical protein